MCWYSFMLFWYDVSISARQCADDLNTLCLFIRMLTLLSFFPVPLSCDTNWVRQTFPADSWNTPMLDNSDMSPWDTDLWEIAKVFTSPGKLAFREETQLHWFSTGSCLSVPSQAEKRVTSSDKWMKTNIWTVPFKLWKKAWRQNKTELIN